MVITESTEPERRQTDESLAVERAKADHALAEKQAAITHEADVIIDRARAEADEVLEAAREKADAKLSNAASSEQALAAIEQERERADRLLRDERATADEVVRRARLRALRLARILPVERGKTDVRLQTERDRSDDALATRDEFLGMVTHDLRDLLQVIILNATTLAESAPQDSDDDHLLAARRILRSASRMNRLVADLVDVASIDAGKLAVVPAPTDAAELLREALATWEGTAQEKGIALECRARDSVTVLVDAERILQVLGNLIANALKFSARGARVVLEVREESGKALVTVSDTGVGIAADKLEMIFERFWQVGANDRRGLGLGLYISRCLVEAHGGTIWAESEPGVGSTFSFTLPTA